MMHHGLFDRNDAQLFVGSVLALLLLLPSIALAEGRGLQLTPDESGRVLVNKDVGTDRFAITRNDNDTLTGNVFRTDGTPPAFVFCTPTLDEDTYNCMTADPCVELGTDPDRGIQETPDFQSVLVNKDVGSDRWAISQHADGTVTGNVFREGETSPAFIYCTPTGEENEYTCFGADACTAEPCIDQYTLIDTVVLPDDFFTVEEPCGELFSFAAQVTLPPDFFAAPLP